MPQTVQCPQCKAAVAIRDEAAGKRVQCPQCGKEFLAPGFAPSQNDDDEWLMLDHEVHSQPAAAKTPPPPPAPSPPAATPAGDTSAKPPAPAPPLSTADQEALGQYGNLDDFTSHSEPLPSSGPSADNPFDGLPPMSAPATAAPQAEDIEYESEYRVYCKVCGTILYAKATQQGKTITCGDCHSKVVVPPPPRKKKKPQLNVDNAATFSLGQSAPVERKDPFVKSAEELLEEAERTAEDEPEPTFETPDVRDWALKVFGVFFDPGVLAHWLGLSMLAALPTYLALWLEHKMLVLALFPGAIFFAALVVACGFAIMISVANGGTRVSDWPTTDPISWLEQLMVAFAAAGLAGFPAWVVGHAVFQPGLLAIALTMFAVYTLFPFFLLSMLDMNSVMMPISPEVARSVSRCQEAWGGFYFSSGLLFAGLYFLFIALSGASLPAASVVGIFFTVAAAFMYFAMIGRLAYSIGQAVNDPPGNTEVDRSRPEEG